MEATRLNGRVPLPFDRMTVYCVGQVTGDGSTDTPYRIALAYYHSDGHHMFTICDGKLLAYKGADCLEPQP